MGKKYDYNYIQNLIKTDCIYDITDPELLRVIISECSDHEFNKIKKLDLSGVCFDGINVIGFDFTGCKGVKINPQTVWDKSLEDVKLSGVEIIGSFDSIIDSLAGVDIEDTDFTKSSFAKMELRKVKYNALKQIILNEIETNSSNLEKIKILKKIDDSVKKDKN